SLMINRHEYILETPAVTQELLASGELSFEVQKALRSVVDEWVKTSIGKVTITSISPNHLERSRGMALVTIRGEGFQRGLLLFLMCKNGPAQIIAPGQIV